MKLKDAYDLILEKDIVEKPFSKVFSDKPIDLINKGKVGQLLECLLNIKNGNSLLDFEDGELKTNKAKENGLPLETMFITQISSHIDDLLKKQKFECSNLFKKISRLLYLPVVKIGDPKNWYFKHPIFFELKKEKDFYLQLREDYYSIIHQMKEHINKSGKLHTSNGKYIQIRTKDSKPYHPIYSMIHNTYISNKNFAFYFKKDFMLDLLRKSDKYPDIV